MGEHTTYVGLDVHKETIVVAVAFESGEVIDGGTIRNRPEDRQAGREVGDGRNRLRVRGWPVRLRAVPRAPEAGSDVCNCSAVEDGASTRRPGQDG